MKKIIIGLLGLAGLVFPQASFGLEFGMGDPRPADSAPISGRLGAPSGPGGGMALEAVPPRQTGSRRNRLGDDAPALSTVIGKWRLIFQPYIPESRKWFLAWEEKVEFTATPSAYGYEAVPNANWALEAGKLIVRNESGEKQLAFTRQPDGTWIGNRFNPDGTVDPITNQRWVLIREDR